MAEGANRRVQYLAGICASVAFMFTGATLAWSSPAIPKLKSGEAGLNITDAQTSWAVSLHGLGALAGCAAGQVLIERAGCKRTMFGSAVPALLGASLIMVSRSAEVMYLARTLMGLATGIIAVVTMIYVTEIADAASRGALGMCVQVMNNVGSLAVYSVGPYVSYAALNGLVLSIPLAYVLLCLWIPESPYYLLKVGRLDAARREFAALRGIIDEKCLDEAMSAMRAHVRESMENKATVSELLTNKRYRKAIYIVIGLKLVQYMTGILVIQSYLQEIFMQGGSSSAPLASILYGVVQLLAGVCATFLTRAVSRRALLLASCAGAAFCMAALGACFYLRAGAAGWWGAAAVLGFCAWYAQGLATLPYVLQTELFPVNVKGAASSLATMLACVLSFLVVKCYQSAHELLGQHVVFWGFAAAGAVGLVFIYCCVPETRGKTLEQVLDDMRRPGEREASRPGERDALTAGDVPRSAHRVDVLRHATVRDVQANSHHNNA